MKKEFTNLDDIYDLFITNIETGMNQILRVTYNNGEIIQYDMTPILKGKLELLKDNSLFDSAFIDEFGNVAWDIDKNIDSNVHWDNRIDISKETIYMDGIKIDPVEKL